VQYDQYFNGDAYYEDNWTQDVYIPGSIMRSMRNALRKMSIDDYIANPNGAVIKYGFDADDIRQAAKSISQR